MNARAFLTTSTQVGVSMGVGDLACQALENKRASPRPDAASSATGSFVFESWDVDRSRVMTTTGFCVTAPWSHLQYQLLERWAPGNLGRAIARKVAASAALAPVSLSLLFTSVLAQQGSTLDQIADKLRADVLPAWKTGALYWPAVLTMNFRWVPVGHRPLVAALFGSIWSVYLSFMANREEEADDTILLLDDEAVPIPAR